MAVFENQTKQNTKIKIIKTQTNKKQQKETTTGLNVRQKGTTREGNYWSYCS